MWFSSFVERALVSRVKRRIPIRMVRLLRSTWLVDMCASSGRPSTVRFLIPVHSADVSNAGHARKLALEREGFWVLSKVGLFLARDAGDAGHCAEGRQVRIRHVGFSPKLPGEGHLLIRV